MIDPSAVVSVPVAVVRYEVANEAGNTLGGARFDAEIGIDYARSVLADAASFIWSVFRQPPLDRKPVNLVTLIVRSMGGVAHAIDDAIHFSAEYIANFSVGDVRKEFAGVVFHEAVHVWQWSGNGEAGGGIIEGVADFVRLKAGLAPAHWVSPGEGERWDRGYDVTARFLEYLEGLREGFVAELNAKMKDGYSDDFFHDLLGKTVDGLWEDYKARYASSST